MSQLQNVRFCTELTINFYITGIGVGGSKGVFRLALGALRLAQVQFKGCAGGTELSGWPRSKI